MNKRLQNMLGNMITTEYLKGQGYEVLEMSHPTRYGVIDVIAKKEGMVVFVDVAYEPKKHEPQEILNYYKKKSLQHSIAGYVSKNNIKLWRLDVCELRKESKSYKVDYFEYIAF